MFNQKISTSVSWLLGLRVNARPTEKRLREHTCLDLSSSGLPWGRLRTRRPVRRRLRPCPRKSKYSVGATPSTRPISQWLSLYLLWKI